MEKVETMEMDKKRKLRITFTADTASRLAWKFKPTLRSIDVNILLTSLSDSEFSNSYCLIKVHPGETTLAFFTAKNPLDVPVDGVATYAVVPVEAGAYLNKIQCFCFEEQRLNPKEEVNTCHYSSKMVSLFKSFSFSSKVDLPVFFYIDPTINEDPVLSGLEEIILEYKFWTTKEGMNLPFIDKLKAIVA